LPSRTDTGYLENEDSIIIEKIINLTQELGVVADTNVLEVRDKSQEKVVYNSISNDKPLPFPS